MSECCGQVISVAEIIVSHGEIALYIVVVCIAVYILHLPSVVQLRIRGVEEIGLLPGQIAVLVVVILVTYFGRQVMPHPKDIAIGKYLIKIRGRGIETALRAASTERCSVTDSRCIEQRFAVIREVIAVICREGEMLQKLKLDI